MVVEHVDDLIYAGNDEFEKSFIKKIKERFPFCKEGNAIDGFKYTRVDVSQSSVEKWITLEEKEYARNVTAAPLGKKHKR